MKVLINGASTDGERSGVGSYVLFLSQALPRVAGPDWSFVSPRPAPALASVSGWLRAKARGIPLAYAAKDWLARLFWSGERSGADLYHETNHALLPFEGPTVMTVYDLSVRRFPETHPPQRVRFYEDRFYPRLGEVSHLIAISQSVKRELVRDLQIPENRITVTPLGLDPQFAPVDSAATAAAVQKVRSEERPLRSFRGSLEPRKNLGRLLAAYARLLPALRRRFPLAVIGGAGWLMTGWKDLLRKEKIEGDVRPLGYVPQADLPALYSGAALMAYPSLYEGFGLPPLEAMGCGCPVLTSNVSSLPEVVGDAAVTVDPMDVEAIGGALGRLLESPEERESLRRRGLARARLFSWEECARLTLDAYQKAAPAHAGARP